jgi:hypothetical protein
VDDRKAPVWSPDDVENMRQLAELYKSMPEEVVDFLKELRKSDVEKARRGLELVTSLEHTGRVLKWVILSFLACVVGVATLGDSLKKITAFFGKW